MSNNCYPPAPTFNRYEWEENDPSLKKLPALIEVRQKGETALKAKAKKS